MIVLLFATSNAIVRLVLTAMGTRFSNAEQRLRGGRVIGPLERVLIFGLGLAGQATAAAPVIGDKGLLRTPELNNLRGEQGAAGSTARPIDVGDRVPAHRFPHQLAPGAVPTRAHALVALGTLTRMPMLTVADGGRLHYEIAGEGPVVTFLHPGLWDMRTWDREVRSFADAGYRVLRYDARGYGESSRPEPGVTYSHVQDLVELLDATEVTQTAVVGCSMGGGTELEFALAHPERVWALVLVASALPGFEPTEEEEEWDAQVEGPIEAAIEAGDLERAQELELEIWASLGTDDERGARIRQIAFDNLHVLEMDESGAWRLDPPPARRLEEFDVPTLILDAEHDPPYMHRIASLLAREIIGARLEVVAGADHVINLRQPERFEELVLPFLTDATPR